MFIVKGSRFNVWSERYVSEKNFIPQLDCKDRKLWLFVKIKKWFNLSSVVTYTRNLYYQLEDKCFYIFSSLNLRQIPYDKKSLRIWALKNIQTFKIALHSTLLYRSYISKSISLIDYDRSNTIIVYNVLYWPTMSHTPTFQIRCNQTYIVK